MNPGRDTNALSLLADETVQHLKELVELLEQEQTALKNREFESIVACTKEKEGLLAKLEQLDTQRLAFAQQHKPAFATELQSSMNDKISSLLQKCRDLNIVNGGIVEISKQFNQRMLNTILGAAAQDDNLYDATGNNSGNKLKQVFARI